MLDIQYKIHPTVLNLLSKGSGKTEREIILLIAQLIEPEIEHCLAQDHAKWGSVEHPDLPIAIRYDWQNRAFSGGNHTKPYVVEIRIVNNWQDLLSFTKDDIANMMVDLDILGADDA